MGVFAEFERAMIQERVRAGLARAKTEGTQLGRLADGWADRMATIAAALLFYRSLGDNSAAKR
jgi:DNA invertase Pin-like site-specific DNA recombinase